MKKITLFNFIEYLVLIFGCFIIAVSFNLFLYPNRIASGGVPGLSIILYKLLNVNIAYTQWGVNAPLFFLGIIVYGKNFGLKTLVSSFCIPFFIFFTQKIAIFSISILLASILGGIGVGIGLAFILKSKGSAGGFTLLAQIIHHYTKIKLSNLILILNVLVIFLAGFTFSFSGAIYAIISLIITSLSVDILLFFLRYEKI